MTENNAAEQEIDGFTTDYLHLQVSCMLLQHAACIEMKKNDQTKGLEMLAEARAMHNALMAQQERFLGIISQEELDASYARIGFKKILFTSLNDAALKSNHWLFDIGTRPQGTEFACDNATFEQKMRMNTLELFPEILAAS